MFGWSMFFIILTSRNNWKKERMQMCTKRSAKKIITTDHAIVCHASELTIHSKEQLFNSYSIPASLPFPA